MIKIQAQRLGLIFAFQFSPLLKRFVFPNCALIVRILAVHCFLEGNCRSPLVPSDCILHLICCFPWRLSSWLVGAWFPSGDLRGSLIVAIQTYDLCVGNTEYAFIF